MSRSFRKTYRGKPFQALRGWPQGKKRAIMKGLRYKLQCLYDEEGTPDLAFSAFKKWRHFVGTHSLREPVDNNCKIITRNRRRFLIRSFNQI